MDTLKKIGYIFNRKQKYKLLFLGIVIIIGALWELLGITAILPFINVAVNPDSIYKNQYLSYFYERLNMTSPNTFLALLAFMLIIIYVIKNVYLTIMNYGIYRFTYNNQRQIATKLLRSYLKQPYTFFLKTNSADLIRNISEDVSMLFDTVLSAMQLMVEFIVCGLLLVFLLFMDKSITIGVGIVLVVFLFVMMRSLKKNIQSRGQKVREARAGMTKWLLQTFGGIKENKIMERDSFFMGQFDEQYAKFANNHCVYQTLSYMPKPAMETLCIGSVLFVIALKLLRGVDSTYFISTMSIFAVAAFRLLPAFNRIMGYVSRIMFNKTGVTSVYHDLREIEELEKQSKEQDTTTQNGPLPFQKEITISKIGFHYPEVETWVLKDVNLVIPKNHSVAFIGPSGAGKTTLADIILGVLSPQEGQVLVDGEDARAHMSSWHAKLGYIPQSIYLMDDTIRHNIAYAVEEKDISEEQINKVIEEAQLKDFINTLENGIDTVIGEKGVRLSGGQRQRIGIARALYDNPEILILDEATSALDTDTETAVMEAINSLAGKKTLLIIAHRLSTIENCDLVYEIKNESVTVKKK